MSKDVGIYTLREVLNMENPVELVVAAFPDEERAGEVLEELKELERMKFIGMWNAAVITKDAEGKLKLKETAEIKGVKRGAGIGAIAGGIIGILAGGPIGGIVLGAAAGALGGKVIDLGFSDKDLKEMGDLMGPGSSAIIAVIEHKWVGELVDALEDMGAEILRQELKDEVAATIAAGAAE
jgi:uncharacterized membrane protein